MDPKFLEELQKLKEQKEANLNKIQDLAQFSIPDFDEVDVVDEDLHPEDDETAGGTIKFEKVTERDDLPRRAAGGRRGKKGPEPKPVIDEATRKKRAKIRNTVLITMACVLAVVAISITSLIGIRKANQQNYSYPYWGMGVSIENGVNTYTFFGNLKEITQYGTIGQVTAKAEFRKGNCIRETVYDAEGNVDYYYAHEYDKGVRILSSYHKDGQMVYSAKYVKQTDGTVKAETTYYQEDNRIENAILTLSEDGNIKTAELYTDNVLTVRKIYSGILVTEESKFDPMGQLKTRTVFDYNAAKQLEAQTDYDAAGAIVGRMVNQYNEKKLLTKTIYYNGTGDVLEYETYNYDLNNNPIKQVKYSGDGTMQHQILKVFNDKNRVTKETSLKSDGSIVYCHGFDYDEKGYISKSIIYNTENSTVIDRYTINVRNDAGGIIETKTHNSANILVEREVYNNSGFLTEQYKFSDGGVLILELKNKYDNKLRLTETSNRTYNDKGTLLLNLNEKYNDRGLVISRIRENAEEDVYEQLLMEYDENGKMIHETMFNKMGKTIYDRTYEKELLASETLYEDGKETTYNEYTYNDKKQVVLKKSLDCLTSELIRISYTYDKEGLLLSALESDVMNRPIALKEYNEDGTVYKQTNYTESGDIVDYYRFEYDAEGRIIVKETFNEFGQSMEKIVYYPRPDGGYDYTLYNQDGIAIEDSRGPEYLPDEDDIPPDAPPEEGYENHRPGFTPSTSTDSDDETSDSGTSDTSVTPDTSDEN